MPTEKRKRIKDLELIDEILSRSHAICWTTPEGMEQLTDSDSSRLLRLARLGALVEMMPDWAYLERGTAEWAGWWRVMSQEPFRNREMAAERTPTAALEAAFGLGEECEWT